MESYANRLHFLAAPYDSINTSIAPRNDSTVSIHGSTASINGSTPAPLAWLDRVARVGAWWTDQAEIARNPGSSIPSSMPDIAFRARTRTRKVGARFAQSYLRLRACFRRGAASGSGSQMIGPTLSPGGCSGPIPSSRQFQLREIAMREETNILSAEPACACCDAFTALTSPRMLCQDTHGERRRQRVIRTRLHMAIRRIRAGS
eukprot:1806055-Rhodomonas_salina.3